MEAKRIALSAADLRRVFEKDVCDIHQADLAAKKRLQYRIPIVQRGKLLGISQADAEKWNSIFNKQ